MEKGRVRIWFDEDTGVFEARIGRFPGLHVTARRISNLFRRLDQVVDIYLKERGDGKEEGKG